jgi:hypothetical protein
MMVFLTVTSATNEESEANVASESDIVAIIVPSN